MKAIDRLLKQKENQIKQAINTLTDIAFDNREHIHIFVCVTPHTDDITVTAYSADFDWSESKLSQPMLLQSVKLSQESTLLKLLETEDKLIDLIADARELKESEVTA